MAKGRRKGVTKQDYLLGLKHFGQSFKNWWSKTRAKEEWLKYRREQIAQGVDMPNITSAAKAEKEYIKAQQQYDYEDTFRDDEMRTETPDQPIEKASEVIEEFLRNVEIVYKDTLDYIANLPAPKKYGKGRFGTAEGYYLSSNLTDLELSYREILSMIENMRGANHKYDVLVAQELAANKELEYTRALIFIPPSGVQNNFEVTLEMLEGIARAVAAEVGGI